MDPQILAGIIIGAITFCFLFCAMLFIWNILNTRYKEKKLREMEHKETTTSELYSNTLTANSNNHSNEQTVAINIVSEVERIRLRTFSQEQKYFKQHGITNNNNSNISKKDLDRVSIIENPNFINNSIRKTPLLYSYDDRKRSVVTGGTEKTKKGIYGGYLRYSFSEDLNTNYNNANTSSSSSSSSSNSTTDQNAAGDGIKELEGLTDLTYINIAKDLKKFLEGSDTSSSTTNNNTAQKIKNNTSNSNNTFESINPSSTTANTASTSSSSSTAVGVCGVTGRQFFFALKDVAEDDDEESDNDDNEERKENDEEDYDDDEYYYHNNQYNYNPSSRNNNNNNNNASITPKTAIQRKPIISSLFSNSSKTKEQNNHNTNNNNNSSNSNNASNKNNKHYNNTPLRDLNFNSSFNYDLTLSSKHTATIDFYDMNPTNTHTRINKYGMTGDNHSMKAQSDQELSVVPSSLSSVRSARLDLKFSKNTTTSYTHSLQQ